MVGQVGGHGRRGPQRAVDRAEVVDGTRPEHLTAQAGTALGQVTGTACERRQAGTEGGVQAFDEGGVDAAQFTLTEGDQFIDALATAMHDAALDRRQHPPTVVFDDLHNVEVGPGEARRSADLATAHDIGERAQDDFGIGGQAIGRTRLLRGQGVRG